MHNLILSDYDDCIVNVVASIAQYFGVPTGKKTNKIIDKMLENNPKNVVLMVFDGLGVDAVRKNLDADGFFNSHMIGETLSVFPSTTTAATVSWETGLTPYEHGWLGWSCYFKEIDTPVDLFLSNKSYEKEPAADYHVPNKFMPLKKLVDKIGGYHISPFAKHKAGNAKEICDKIRELLSASNNSKNYFYCYNGEPDATMHEFGTYSDKAIAVMEEIEKEISNLKLLDTLIIVTADHGHIPCEIVNIDDYPKLMSLLKTLPTIEPRAASFFVKDGCLDEFKNEFLSLFKNDFILYENYEAKKLFGSGNPSPKTHDFIGDFLAVAKGNKGIWYKFKSGNSYAHFKSAHAGITEEEMKIPLILIDNG
jgi:hypothetical protein